MSSDPNDETSAAPGLKLMSTFDDDDEPLPTERSLGYLRRRLDAARKKLAKSLGRVDGTEDFLRMIWSIDKIGEGNKIGWRWFTKTPEHLVKFASEPHHIHKWTLESLVNAFLLSQPLRRRGDRAWKVMNTRHLGAPLQLLQMTNELENAHDGLALRRVSVFDEMRRIAQRQFHWQRGKMNKAAFFKAAYLYTFPEAAEYFEQKHGVSIHDFCFSGFALVSMLLHHPAVQARPNVEKRLEIDPEVLINCIGMYAQPESVLRREASAMTQVTSHAAYQSSVLRKWPCVLIEGKGIIVGPIPDLVVERFTNGLYYDLVDNSGELRDLIGRRFEGLCKLMLEAFLPDLQVVPEFRFGPAKHRIDSPDFFLTDKGETLAIIECKAKKAPISVKLGEEIDPLHDPAFAELAKAAFQIWRFVSRVRRGMVEAPGGRLASGAPGVVVLMDTWLEMSGGQIEEVFERARAMVAEKEPEILAEDQIPLVFCNIDELENVLRSTTARGAMLTLREAVKTERAGWLLTSLQNEVAKDERADKDDALDPYLDDVVKWWPKAG